MFSLSFGEACDFARSREAPAFASIKVVQAMTRIATEWSSFQEDPMLFPLHDFSYSALYPTCKILTSLRPGAHSRISLRVHDVQICSQNLKTTNFAKHVKFTKLVALVMGSNGTRDSDLYGVCEQCISCTFVALAHVPLGHATAGAVQHLHQ